MQKIKHVEDPATPKQPGLPHSPGLWERSWQELPCGFRLWLGWKCWCWCCCCCWWWWWWWWGWGCGGGWDAEIVTKGLTSIGRRWWKRHVRILIADSCKGYDKVWAPITPIINHLIASFIERLLFYTQTPRSRGSPKPRCQLLYIIRDVSDVEQCNNIVRG